MPQFLFLAGDAALDLANTTLVLGGELTDLLASDEDARAWLEAAGFAAPADARGLAAMARRLREAIRSLAIATIEKRAPDAASVATLNGFLARPAASHALARRGERLVATIEPLRNDAASSLYPVAVAALRLLTERDPRHIKKCASPRCVLVFYDATKSHTRRWCSMGLCGNRAKVAQFARRQRGEAAPRRTGPPLPAPRENPPRPPKRL